MATPQDREFIWINPSNLNLAGDSTGLDAGYAAGNGTGAFSALLHLPFGISAGFGNAQADFADPNEYYDSPYQDRPSFTALALSKRGFGSEPRLAGLPPGLATRSYSNSEYQANGDSYIKHQTIRSLDFGLGWDLPRGKEWEDCTSAHTRCRPLRHSARIASSAPNGNGGMSPASGTWSRTLS